MVSADVLKTLLNFFIGRRLREKQRRRERSRAARKGDTGGYFQTRLPEDQPAEQRH